MAEREPYLPHGGRSGDIYSAVGITASPETLMRQAAMTADEYLRSAIGHIDQAFGKGYARQHPELVGMFMQTAAADYGAAAIVQRMESMAGAMESVAQATENVADAMRDTSSDDAAKAIQTVAVMVDELASAIKSGAGYIADAMKE